MCGGPPPPAGPPRPPPAGPVPPLVFLPAHRRGGAAAGRDETIPMLCKMRIGVDLDEVTMACTDRYRLTYRRVDWVPADGDVSYDLCILPRPLEAVCDAVKGGDVSVRMATNRTETGEVTLVGFRVGDRVVTSRVGDTEFINAAGHLKGVNDKGYRTTLLVPTEPFLAAIKRADLVRESREAVVRITVDREEIRIGAGAGSQAMAEPIAATVHGEIGGTIAFNPQFLREGITAVGGDRIRMEIDTPVRPIMCTPDLDDTPSLDSPYRYLIMPIRIAS
ncbi:DNA polymerase III subunit beta [Streptosporangium sp. NPDC051023]|uniref:DNA polymerase III subunit beta n=1 Tax=Streptosporangium sp. NPDC051023 TaxID=3155410 RepID=UPI00344B5BD6